VVEAAPDGTGSYDDERLAGLIETASIRLMRLSMEHAHALYLQDADAAAIAADDLHAFSVRLLGEVQPLQVSPEQQPVKDEFIRIVGAILHGKRDPSSARPECRRGVPFRRPSGIWP